MLFPKNPAGHWMSLLLQKNTPESSQIRLWISRGEDTQTWKWTSLSVNQHSAGGTWRLPDQSEQLQATCTPWCWGLHHIWGQIFHRAHGPRLTRAQMGVSPSCWLPSGFAEACPHSAPGSTQHIQPGLRFRLSPFSSTTQCSPLQQAHVHACPWSWIKRNYT